MNELPKSVTITQDNDSFTSTMDLLSSNKDNGTSEDKPTDVEVINESLSPDKTIAKVLNTDDSNTN